MLLANFRNILSHFTRGLNIRTVTYIQGQVEPESNVREYFYYIDHQGMLFLDDAKMKNFTSCFKEKKFLAFFFKHLTKNTSKRFEMEFPYVSPCGREMNYIRCEDLPIVFTEVLFRSDEKDQFLYGYAGELLSVPFEPEKLCMFPQSGRVYHPAFEKVGGVGLVKSNLAIEFSRLFLFGNGEIKPPTHFVWKNIKHTLTNELFSSIKNESHKPLQFKGA